MNKIPFIDYENARNEYLNYLKHNSGLNKVIEFGNIKAPGLSDLDWLIIYDMDLIKNANFLKPQEYFSSNFRNAFQHRPIFLEKKYESYLGEFILPTKMTVYYGDSLKNDIFHSIDSEKRNVSIGFEFFKRQKAWLRKPIFDSFTFKKKIALFVSILNHSKNPIFNNYKLNWNELDEKISKLRNNFLNNKYEKTSIELIREISIKFILSLEKILNNWILKNYEKVVNKKKYYSDIFWTKNIQFNNDKNTLINSLKMFPILFINETKDYGYFFKKYKIIESISLDMKLIGLKDGIISDLGFNNWFPNTIRERIYIIKNNFFLKFIN